MNAFSPQKRGPKPSPYAGKVAIRHLIEAGKAAGLDVAGFEALPDGSVRVFTAAAAPKPNDLFDELDRKGKL